MINKKDNQYSLGTRKIKQTSDSSHSYDMVRLFGEEVYRVRPWTFVSGGDFPCVLYAIYFNVASESRLTENENVIKSAALFRSFVIYLTSGLIHFVKILGLSLIHICRCRRYAVCRSRWSPYH
eukprot:TRINITY_DN10474_c0_g1_i1.p1 TRINITY_DN10474_c0_g1~~TRINITY_DN10474_c0_g1_i1.p1  ORF type:complete len:123 (+),score=11.57 TRINITY_DN10474_c0_g1_i1:93-461(+)